MTNIQYYVRLKNYQEDLTQKPFEKINYNILSTNQQWKTIYFFKDNYIPIFEEYYYRDGGYYSFKTYNLKNDKTYNLVQQLINLINNKNTLAGIQIRTLFDFKSKKPFFVFEIWSLANKENMIIDDLYKITKKYLLENNIIFNLFYPPPIQGNDTLSLVNMRNKKLYFLRFDFILGRKLFIENQWWEIFMLEYFKKYYKNNTNVIDIGGNIGSHTLLLSEIVSTGNKIYVFDPVYADVIEMNVKANHLENKVVIYDEGLGNKNEEIDIPTYNRLCARNFGRFSIKESNIGEEIVFLSNETKKQCEPIIKKIKVTTLDSKNFQNISLIKLDVEGMEIEVLEGGVETIKRERPVIFIEIWNKFKEETLKKPIFQKILKEFNYFLIPIHGYFGDDYILYPM